MKCLFKCPFGKKAASANVVDGKLILSFPEALTPVVWQMDLRDAKSSALEVHENAPSGEGENKSAVSFSLILKTQKGEAVEIAPFAEREQAIKGLMSVSSALQNAHGQIRPASTINSDATANVTQVSGTKNRWLPAVLGLGFLIVLFMVWANIAPRTPGGGFVQPTLDSAANTTSAPSPDEPGVPVSADDFLKNR